MSQTCSQTWDHVCTVLLQSTGGSPIQEALQLAGIPSIPDLMQAKESDLDSLVYPDPNHAKLTLRLPVGQRRKVRAIQAYNSHVCFMNSSPIVAWSTLMLDDFDNFRITAYEPDQPIAKFQRISIHGGNSATVLHGTPGPNVNSVTPKFTSFMRGVTTRLLNSNDIGMTGMVDFARQRKRTT
jgi:hypothetical protein